MCVWVSEWVHVWLCVSVCKCVFIIELVNLWWPCAWCALFLSIANSFHIVKCQPTDPSHYCFLPFKLTRPDGGPHSSNGLCSFLCSIHMDTIINNQNVAHIFIISFLYNAHHHLYNTKMGHFHMNVQHQYMLIYMSLLFMALSCSNLTVFLSWLDFLFPSFFPKRSPPPLQPLKTDLQINTHPNTYIHIQTHIYTHTSIKITCSLNCSKS